VITGLFTFAAIIKLGTMRFVKNTALVRKIILLFFTLHSLHLIFAQNKPDKEFSIFAQRQDSLFIRAYQQKDTITYLALLSDFMEKYNLLKAADKKTFNGYYINASYNLCCTYALLNNKKQALYYLNKSIKDGYSDYLHLLGDSDLTILRNESEFKKLIQSLRETADFLYILQKAAVYNLNDKREVPSFTYQSDEQSDLITLCKFFKLDSVAGSGNEVSKILNLMHWMHNLIPHDGNHENPIVKNAMNMIMVCKKDTRGLNCRGLATVLNECYLAMGYKSRFVTCLPKDSLGTDNDCHVINMVYSNVLQKWLWIDPTFDAYVMNEKGELLSIEEVRNRIILNEPLIINPDANWNHSVSQTKASYLDYYMAKNLYRLQCPLNSEYDLETIKPGKEIIYLDLLPLDYFRQSPDKTVDTYNGTKLIFYKTTNSTIFWQKP
jgi:hypothetical protein